MASSGRRARTPLPARLVGASFDAPGRALACWGLLLLGALVGVFSLEVDTSTDSILDRLDPAFAFHLRSQRLFGGEEVVVVALESEQPFDPALLAHIEGLSERFEASSVLRRVDSLSTVPLIRGTPDGGLRLDAALDAGVPRSVEERAAFETMLRRDRIAPRTLFSDDGRMVALTLILEGDAKGRFLEIVEEVRSAVAGLPARVTGVPVFRTEINTRTQSEILFFAPITGAILGALLFLFFRAFSAVWIPLAVGGAGALVMLAAMALLGTSLTLLSMILPSIVLALGCAYVMHMLAAAARAEDEFALRAGLLAVARPVALSGLTTAIGFATIGAVRVDAVREVGGYGALGVFVVTAACLTAVPALLRRFPIAHASRKPFLLDTLRGPLLEALCVVASERRGAVLLGWTLSVALLALGLLRLPVETDATQWFRPDSAVRQDYEQIRSRLSGISPVNIVIEATGERRVTEPDALAAIDALTTHLAKHPAVGKAVSVADPLRQLHGDFSDDATQPLPGNRPLVEQYLLLIASVESLGDLITNDRRAANIVLRVDDNASGALRAVAREAERWWQANGPPDFHAQGTGTMFEFARAEDEMVYGQLRGFGLALLAVGAILWAVLRSGRLALLALVPNALPVVAIFGFMGLVGVALDAGTVMLGSIALGIAVDDTMHIVNGVQTRSVAGATPRAGLRDTLFDTLPALVYTTLAVSAAFAVLGASSFTYIRNLGLLTAGIMAICLLADLLLLPALLLSGSRESAGEAAPLAS